jgi:ABC-type uncharacterized transport system fused permease/ATPase subunit
MFNIKKLRCFIGCLAFALPWIVVLILGYFPKSISITYYTEARDVFMIILGACSVMLMYYDGYDKTDDVLNTIAGIFGLLICLFPCAYDIEKVGTFQIPVDISANIHNISAAVFFAILSYVSLFQFTKSNGNMTEKKKKRNVIYRVCGIGMIVSFTILLLPSFYIQAWLTEMFALSFFGISWLTKANAYKWLFAD